MDENVKDTTTVEALLEQMKTMVPAEKLEQLQKENATLVKEVANNRTVVKQEEPKKKEETRDDIIERCKKRTASIGQGSSLQQISSLCENYRDMQKLGMDVGNVDEDIVEGLESIILEAKGDDTMFKALMETRVKVTK